MDCKPQAPPRSADETAVCVPLLLILLATAGGTEAHPFTVVAEEIGYGVLCGAGAALLSAAIVVLAGRRNLIDKTWQQIVPLATTIAAYGAANALGGSGFIAAFVAGALFGLHTRD
jgi:sodium/hydrogen antiporter